MNAYCPEGPWLKPSCPALMLIGLIMFIDIDADFYSLISEMEFFMWHIERTLPLSAQYIKVSISFNFP